MELCLASPLTRPTCTLLRAVASPIFQSRGVAPRRLSALLRMELTSARQRSNIIDPKKVEQQSSVEKGQLIRTSDPYFFIIGQKIIIYRKRLIFFIEYWK